MTKTLPTFEPRCTTEGDDTGFGMLKSAGGCLPLTDMNVSSKISGLTYTTTVVQAFVNALDSPVEAAYIFPLPCRAAVTSFEFKVRDRVVSGVLKERGQARQEYQQAIQQGKQAALAEEDRSGVFTMQVGNLPPGEVATVELKMVGPLEIAAGEAEFRFPLVVAQRFTEGAPLNGPSVGTGVASDTGLVPDASRVTPPVLLPGMPNPVRLTLDVEIDSTGKPAGDEWKQQVRSSLHTVVVSDTGPFRVCLQPSERLNRDFILRMPACQQEVVATLQVSPAVEQDGAQQPGALALTLMPPHLPDSAPPPRDIVFLLDRSGSMNGWKMVAARRAMARMVDTLADHDRFSVTAFDNALEHPPVADNLGAAMLVPAGDRQRWRTLEWLGGVEARGGTVMSAAITAGLKLLEDNTTGRQKMLVLVSDGQVSGEDMLLRTIAASTARPRVYTIGIDRAVNAAFLNRLAKTSGGYADFVESEDRIDDAMNAMHRQLGAPVLTNVRIEPTGFDTVADSQAPHRIPDLYPSRAVTIYARHFSATAARLKVSGTTPAGDAWSTEVEAAAADNHALLHLWGREKVRELEDAYVLRNDVATREQIVKTSLEAGVLSRFTAYVAVDHSEIVNPSGETRQLTQPVEQVDGWLAEGTRGAARQLRKSRRLPASGRAAPGSGGEMLSASLPEMLCEPAQLADDCSATFDDDACIELDGLAVPPPRSTPRGVRRKKGSTDRKPAPSRPQPPRPPAAWDETRQRIAEALASEQPQYWSEADGWRSLHLLLKQLVSELTSHSHPVAPQFMQLLSQIDTGLQTADAGNEYWESVYATLTSLLDRLKQPAAPRKDFWT